MTNAMHKAIYSTMQAAQLLNVTARTVQLWADSGLLQAGKPPGGHRRIEGDSIQQLLNSMAIAPLHTAPAPPQKSILIVDDDPELQKILCKKINKWQLGVTIFSAEDAYQGLIKVGQLQPDMVLIDLHMPHMSGLHMIAAMQGSSASKNSKIVVISGLPPEAMDRKWLKDSAIPILEKPLPFAALKQIMSDTLARHVKNTEV